MENTKGEMTGTTSKQLKCHPPPASLTCVQEVCGYHSHLSMQQWIWRPRNNQQGSAVVSQWELNTTETDMDGNNPMCLSWRDTSRLFVSEFYETRTQFKVTAALNYQHCVIAIYQCSQKKHIFYVSVTVNWEVCVSSWYMNYVLPF